MGGFSSYSHELVASHDIHFIIWVLGLFFMSSLQNEINTQDFIGFITFVAKSLTCLLSLFSSSSLFYGFLKHHHVVRWGGYRLMVSLAGEVEERGRVWC